MVVPLVDFGVKEEVCVCVCVWGGVWMCLCVRVLRVAGVSRQARVGPIG